jgi:mRNA-degrading endonuclease toxin of MazEF toxin-antitoxin module
MSICHTCKIDREAEGKTPRELVILSQVTANKNLPVLVCPFCDGGALEFSRKFTE